MNLESRIVDEHFLIQYSSPNPCSPSLLLCTACHLDLKLGDLVVPKYTDFGSIKIVNWYHKECSEKLIPSGRGQW